MCLFSIYQKNRHSERSRGISQLVCAHSREIATSGRTVWYIPPRNDKTIGKSEIYACLPWG